VQAGRLVTLLESYEPPPPPIHVVYPAGRMSVAKARAFVDLADAQIAGPFRRLSGLSVTCA